MWWAKQTPSLYGIEEFHLNTNTYAGPTPVILATQEAEISRIKFHGQTAQIILETLS
jgi:hypothetical protein